MSATCLHHTDTTATGHCAGCAEPFCGNCLLELNGSTYCGSCKVMALGGRTPMLETGMTPSNSASEAMRFAIIGVIFNFCILGIVLGPMAIGKGLGARREIRDNVMLTGWGKANAAIFIGILAIVLWTLNFVAKMVQ